jgi:uncharacterized protein YecE (DUF72 family)
VFSKNIGGRVPMSKSKILVGTSGWSYRSWRGPFFPDKLPARSQLTYYAKQFLTTELNGVFYRTPTIGAVRSWAAATPDQFIFAWKASKFITHWKRLQPTSRNSLDLLETRLKLLGDKAGPVLFQLPPNFKKDRERLASFLKLLRRRHPYAFEFRHASWYEDDILDLLRNAGSALCISDHHDAPAPWLATAQHVYIRGHGPQGRYRGRYPRSELKEWALWSHKQTRRGRTVYVYFDNDQKSAAPLDALSLLSCIKGH